MKKLLFSLALLCLSLSASAQQADTAATHRHHIGIIATPMLDKLFTSNQELPVGLIYRWQHRPNATFRATLIGSHDSQEYTSKGTYAYSNFYNNFLQITGGYEWNLSISNIWSFYYGTEGGLFFRNTETKNSLSLQDDASQYHQFTLEEKNGFLLRPFAGIMLRIGKRFYLATETAILARYQRQEYNSQITSLSTSGETLTVQNSHGIWKTTSVKYQPLSNISFGLKF
jgi:hypothetical protein